MGEIGTRCICGLVTDLTFEHIPPKAAYNDKGIFEAKIDKLIESDWMPGDSVPDVVKRQRGAGRNSLCGKCNNDTGSWYGTSYVEFAERGMHLLYSSMGAISLAYPYRIFPLRILKQVAVMFFSACGPTFQARHRELVKFVLDRDERQVPGALQFYAYLLHPTKSGATRQSGITTSMIGSRLYTFSEIAFPPFGFVMTVSSPPIDSRLLNINFFANYRFDFCSTVFLKLEALPINTFLPGDFRTTEQVKDTVRENRKEGSVFLDRNL